MFLKSLAYCNVNLQMDLFFEQFSADKWQYSGFWPHTKNGFSYELIIPSSRSEKFGIHVLLSGEKSSKASASTFIHALRRSVIYLQSEIPGMF